VDVPVSGKRVFDEFERMLLGQVWVTVFFRDSRSTAANYNPFIPLNMNDLDYVYTIGDNLLASYARLGIICW
jgi:hypothetical protein